MYKKHIAITIAAATALLLGATSCRKYLDVNTNPNVTFNVQPNLLLPAAELAIGSAVGVDMDINGSIWVQHWTQSTSASQYKYLEQYQPTANKYDRVWSLFYSQALVDLQRMDSLAVQRNLNQYRAISKLLSAYSYQIITDAWGDVPFSQALKGQPEQGNITSPAFDRQADIYDGLVRLVDDGLALINTSDPSHPTTDDVIYGGDMSKWRSFGKTLRLKLFMRLSEVAPGKAQAGVAATMALPGSFIEYGGDANINYYSTAGNQNPLYLETKFLGQNQVASSTSVDSLRSNNDPRLTKFYAPPTATVTAINGQRQGISVLPAATAAAVAYPAPITGAVTTTAGATAPVKLITSYESKLLQAEAVARGWMAGNDSALFAAAVNYNFLAYGVDTASAAAKTYLTSSYWGRYPVGAGTALKVRHIITQKWFSMNGNQGFEAWTEWRRTGYPNFLVLSASPSRQINTFPTIFLYPDVEVSRNAKFPGQHVVTDRVYWDIN